MSEPNSRRGLFIVGASLVVVGAAVSTFAPFFLYLYLLPLWIFLLGVVLIGLSRKSLKMKLAWSLTPVLIFGCYQLLWYQFNKAPAETFLIPQTFRGKIHIHFNEQCGQKPEEDNRRRLYRVPDNGILLSQFSDKQGFMDQQYYLVDPTGKRTPLPQLDVRDYNEEYTIVKNPHEPSRDILGVFHAGRVFSDGTLEFYVCTYRQLRDSLDFQYDKQFDLKEQKAIDLCRKTKCRL